MSQFKTQQEVWQALIDGKMVAPNYRAGYFYLRNGILFDETNTQSGVSFSDFGNFYLYKKPTPKKILKPFLLKFSCSSVGINFCENEEQAKEYCKRHGNDFIGPAKGIPDQEVEEE